MVMMFLIRTGTNAERRIERTETCEGCEGENHGNHHKNRSDGSLDTNDIKHQNGERDGPTYNSVRFAHILFHNG